MKNLKTLLQQLGFIESEAKVILALMELGSAKVADISKKSGVDRVNTYGILFKLMQQGLVSQNEMAGVKTYISEPPERFMQLVKERQENIIKLQDQFQTLLPEFSALYNLNSHRPKVKFYEGVGGIKTIFEDALVIGKNYCHIATLDAMSEELRLITKDYIKQKIALGLHTKALFDKIAWTKNHVLDDKAQNRESRFIPKRYKITTGIRIYGDKVALINYKELTGTIIEDKQISQMMQMFFDVLWDISEIPKQTINYYSIQMKSDREVSQQTQIIL